MANLIHPNGQTVQTDDPAAIQEMMSRGFVDQSQALQNNPGQTIQQISGQWGDAWRAPGGPGYNPQSSSGVMAPTQPLPASYAVPSAPTTEQITSALNPNFQNLQTGQQGIMSGVEGLATGQQGLAQGQQGLAQGQGTIIANQGVLQDDVQNVGGQVAGVQGSIGVPSTGQSVFGDLGALKGGQQGIMGNISGVTDALGQFRSQFTDYSNQATTQRDVIQKQGLNQRDQLLRGLQDMSPAINNMNRAVSGPVPTTMGAVPNMTTSMGVMAPTVQNVNSGLTATAQNSNTPMGPQGPMAIDPRDYV